MSCAGIENIKKNTMNSICELVNFIGIKFLFSLPNEIAVIQN